MRIGDNPYLNLSSPFGHNPFRNSGAAAVEAAATSLPPEKKTDRSVFSRKGDDYAVQISAEARQAFETYALGQKKKTDQGEEVRDDFLQYMEAARSVPKTIKERIKEQKAKLNKLQGELQKTATDESMPEEVKKPKMEALNTQIQQTMKTIADLQKQLAGDTEPAGESALA